MQRISAKPHPQPRALRVTAGDLASAARIRRLLARIADRLARGILDPRRANALVFAISAAGRVAELEAAEKLSDRLAARRATPIQDNGLTKLLAYDGDVVEAQVEVVQ